MILAGACIARRSNPNKMHLKAKIDFSRYDAAMKSFMATSKRTVDQVTRENARGVIKHAVAVTPPASITESGTGWNVAIGQKAKKQGEEAIKRDLKKIFVRVVIEHKRQEEWPDLQVLYRQHRGRNGRITGRRKYHVDETKLAKLTKDLQAHVGYLASGWLPAARELGAKGIPAWITRHNAPGNVAFRTNGGRMLITVTNACKFAGEIPGLQRRIQYAVNKQAGAMERRVAHYMRRMEERAKQSFKK